MPENDTPTIRTSRAKASDPFPSGHLPCVWRARFRTDAPGFTISISFLDGQGRKSQPILRPAGVAPGGFWTGSFEHHLCDYFSQAYLFSKIGKDATVVIRSTDGYEIASYSVTLAVLCLCPGNQ